MRRKAGERGYFFDEIGAYERRIERAEAHSADALDLVYPAENISKVNAAEVFSVGSCLNARENYLTAASFDERANLANKLVGVFGALAEEAATASIGTRSGICDASISTPLSTEG